MSAHQAIFPIAAMSRAFFMFKNEPVPDQAFEAARRETVYTWQSIVMNDYLPESWILTW